MPSWMHGPWLHAYRLAAAPAGSCFSAAPLIISMTPPTPGPRSLPGWQGPIQKRAKDNPGRREQRVRHMSGSLFAGPVSADEMDLATPPVE